MTACFELASFGVCLPGFTLGPLDVRVHGGERVALVGPNGAGKSTTILALAGRRDGYDGCVRFQGADLRPQLPDARRLIGVLPEEVAAYPWMSVGEHLALHAAFYPTWDAAYAAELLGCLGVDPAAKMGTLSKGTRVKVGFVAAEAPRPPLLLLDEPTSGLDPLARGELLDAVDAAAPRGGARTVVLSTHLLEDVERLAERVLLLRAGQIVADVTCSELRAAAPQRPVAHSLYELLTHSAEPAHVAP